MMGSTGANQCFGWTDALVTEFREAMQVRDGERRRERERERESICRRRVV
jgi:hypothetical protein